MTKRDPAASLDRPATPRGDAAAWVDLAPTPALAIDAGGRIVAANSAMASCLAATVPELMGAELTRWATDRDAVAGFFAQDTELSGEFSFRGGNESERRLALSIARHPESDLRLVAAHDVTPLRAAQKTVAEERDRYLDMMRAASDWFWEGIVDKPGDPDGSLTLFRSNQSGTLKRHDMKVRWPGDQIDLSYDPEGYQDYRRKIAAKQPYRDWIYRQIMPDGREIFMRSSGVPYRRDGIYRGYRGSVIDVTAQVRAELALRQAQEHLARAQRVAAIGSAERDFATGIVEWSEEMYRMFGVPRSFEPQPQNVIALVHAEDRSMAVAAFGRVLSGHSIEPAEYRIIRPDNGEVRTVYVESEVFQDTAGKPLRVLTIFRDVTELRAGEKRRRELEHQLQQSQKLEALGTLAGGVAHEINNALVPVLALTKLVAGKLPDGSREQRHLQTVMSGAERSRDLVKQILAFSRKEEQRRESIDLAAVARDALRLLRATISVNIRFAEEIAPTPPLLGDPNRIHQVIVNLVTNAAHAIGEAPGTITLGLAAAASGGELHLSIADTGCGMDEKTKARIFEPFFTTKEVGKGTGLGLSVVHGIVKEHGGRIAVESTPGRGTRFDIHLPAAATEAVARIATA
jgi:PAS domain S-box-containing protein